MNRRESLRIKRSGNRCLVVIILTVALIAGCGHGKAPLDRSQFFSGSSFTNELGMNFVRIPAGTFMMGSPPDEPGRDINELRHEVAIEKPFYLQTTEVTQELWIKVMGTKPFTFKHGGPKCPVDNVSWHDAVQFVQKLNSMEGTDRYRLPREAEWEYACRAGTSSPFSTGNCITTDQANFNGHKPYPECPEGILMDAPMAAGSFAPNPWGLYDMHGNVWEWCQDCDAGSTTVSTTDIAGPVSQEYRTRRGGSWHDDAAHLRSASRVRLYPEYKFRYGGFRVAADAAE